MENFIKENWFKIGILIAIIICGWFIYAIFERQQDIKASQDKREYIGKRKLECYDILEKERKTFSNVISVKYHEPTGNPYSIGGDFDDSCRVKYEDKKTGESFYKSY